MAYSDIEIEKVFDTIIERIFNGEAIRNILKESEMPSSRTFYSWLDSDPEKVKLYARACEARADAIFDEILDISDDSGNDLIEVDLGDGVVSEKINIEFVQRSRLKVDARKWVVSKLNPKKYGDKLDVNQNLRLEQPIFNGIDLDVPTNNSTK